MRVRGGGAPPVAAAAAARACTQRRLRMLTSSSALVPPVTWQPTSNAGSSGGATGASSRRLWHHLEALCGSHHARRQRHQSAHVLVQKHPRSWSNDGSTEVRVGWAGAAAETVHMSEEDQYMFDLQGFVVLRQVVSQDLIQAANLALDRLEGLAPPCGTGSTDSASTAAGGLPYPCVLGDERTESTYISQTYSKAIYQRLRHSSTFRR